MDKLELDAVCEATVDVKDQMNKAKWVKFTLIHQDEEYRRKMPEGALHDIHGKIVGETSDFFEADAKYKVTIENVK